MQDVEAVLEDFARGAANASGKAVSKDYVRRAARSSPRPSATTCGHIHLNVAEIANLPSTEVTSKERRSLTVDEWRALYDAAADGSASKSS